MNYTIRPIGPEDAEGAAALRRMPGVFENTLGLPSYRTADSEAFIAGLGPDDHNFVAVLDDGTVIGCAGLTVCSNPRMRGSKCCIFQKTSSVCLIKASVKAG